MLFLRPFNEQSVELKSSKQLIPEIGRESLVLSRDNTVQLIRSGCDSLKLIRYSANVNMTPLLDAQNSFEIRVASPTHYVLPDCDISRLPYFRNEGAISEFYGTVFPGTIRVYFEALAQVTEETGRLCRKALCIQYQLFGESPKIPASHTELMLVIIGRRRQHTVP